MKYTYDTNGLKNAMIYALQKAANDAGFDRKDFKPITVDVKKNTRPVMFDATLNYRIVKDVMSEVLTEAQKVYLLF